MWNMHGVFGSGLLVVTLLSLLSLLHLPQAALEIRQLKETIAARDARVQELVQQVGSSEQPQNSLCLTHTWRHELQTICRTQCPRYLIICVLQLFRA